MPDAEDGTQQRPQERPCPTCGQDMDWVHHPIVYLRGYAGSQKEIEDTVATPYMGFNLGSTKARQSWNGDVQRYVFESPLVRLMKDHGYTDIYEHGAEIAHGEVPAQKSVWIYRYYEPADPDLGSGVRPEMEDYAEGLADLLEDMRTRYCGPADSDRPEVVDARRRFKVYVVAHSMGGLVARCYLQAIAPKRGIAHPVDKLYTYGTPHGGIDLRLVGNVPAFLSFNNVDNFNEKRMRSYLAIKDDKTPVNSMNGALDPNHVFCFIGSNHQDYEAALGLARRAVGPMSDGLVQIQNAYVHGAPRAFAYRSHSGVYGMVNSEEGYQNLVRFLLGTARVDVTLDIDDVSFPPHVQEKRDRGKEVKASYHFESVARVRGERWDLSRRTVTEQSAIFVPYERIEEGKPVYLLSAFLMHSARKVKSRKTLGFSLDLGVLVPEYTVDEFLFLDDHYDGGYIFRDKINFEATLEPGEPPKVKYGFDSKTPNRTTRYADRTTEGPGDFTFSVPIHQDHAPGLDGTLLIRSRRWNEPG